MDFPKTVVVDVKHMLTQDIRRQIFALRSDPVARDIPLPPFDPFAAPARWADLQGIIPRVGKTRVPALRSALVITRRHSPGSSASSTVSASQRFLAHRSLPSPVFESAPAAAPSSPARPAESTGDATFLHPAPELPLQPPFDTDDAAIAQGNERENNEDGASKIFPQTPPGHVPDRRLVSTWARPPPPLCYPHLRRHNCSRATRP